MSLTFEIMIIVFLVILNGWFAMSELAIVSARRVRLSGKAAEGSKGAKAALLLAENPGRFLSSVQIGITLVGILAGTYSGATLTDRLTLWITETIPALSSAADAISMAVVVGAITYASLIVGELVPKHIALSNPEKIASLVARPMTVLAKFAAPLIFVLEVSSRLTLKVLGIRQSEEQTITEEEVKAMIDEGTENGVFEPQEKELISGVMRFGDRRIRAIMTPRNEIVWIDLTWDIEKIARIMRESPHSRFPVCKGDQNEIAGVIQAKDLLNSFLEGKEASIEDLVKPLNVVHDNSPALYVLDMLKDSPIHMLLVVDEYGSIEGIVTAADILSAITGSLSEHGEDYEGALVQREDGSWLLDGDVAADIAADRTGCRALRQDLADYTTVAGFILSKSRKIPVAGDYFEWDGWRFEVVDMDGRRIDKVIISSLSLDD